MYLKLHHGALPTSDMAASARFWKDLLGMEAHPKKDNWLGWPGSDYPVHLMPSTHRSPTRKAGDFAQHLALEVETLEAIVPRLLDAKLEPFQGAFDGSVKPITSPDQPLDYGIGTVYIYDLDDNLIEFVQRGRGIFSIG